MSEMNLINNTSMPRTRESIAEDLRDLGLKEGMVVIVHSSLKSLGWVSGGPVAVIQALMDVVTNEGTIIMPTQTGEYSDPSLWEAPPVPKSWIEIIKNTMPAYEPEITPTRGMGIIVETFRKFPGVIRSSHPQNSFAAWGKHAEEIIENHSLDYSLGEESPLARIYDLDGWVLFLGVGYDSNTSFHLSEYRSELAKECKGEAPIIREEKRVWAEFNDIEFDTDVFEQIGSDFEKDNEIGVKLIGSSKSKLFKQKLAVDYATNWLKNKSK